MLDLDSIFDPDRQVPARRPDPEPGTGPDDLPPEWRVEWEERAAVLEYDGGQPRERAEAAALAEVLGQMLLAGTFPRPKS